MRDLLPGEARAHNLAGRRVMGSLELCGYRRVAVPAIEYSDVLDRARSNFDQGDVLRFVEPDTGEVVALRPDMTPQVARLVATRLRDAPTPARLCYQGSVLRRRRERARHHGQITQAGFELIGVSAPHGDLEVVQVATRAVRAAGLQRFTLDVGHAGISGSLLRAVPEDDRGPIVAALRRKDAAEVAELASRARLKASLERALVALPSLWGGEEVWDRCGPLQSTVAEQALDELRQLWEEARNRGLASDLVVDAGETCRFEYYTGAMFQILAPGPGEPVGSGGRYDTLFSGFGFESAAAGFAVDVGNLVWALKASGFSYDRQARVLLAGGGALELEPLAEALRDAGVVCAIHPPAEEGDTFARAWGFSHVLSSEGEGAALRDVASATVSALPTGAPDVVAAAVSDLLGIKTP